MRLSPGLYVGFRNIVGRRKGADPKGGRNHLWGAILGVALSIVPLTIVLFVADGMIEGITSRYLETSTYHVQATPFFSTSLDELESAAKRIADLHGVLLASPEMQGPGVILAPAGTEAEQVPQPTAALVRAVSPSLLLDQGFKSYIEIKSGELSLKRDSDVILGVALAEKLHAEVGQLVSLVTARQGSSEYLPRLTTLRVRGIVSTGYQELDSLWALVSLPTGDRILAPGTRRVFVGIKTAQPFGDQSALEAAIGRAASPGDPSQLGWNIQDWKAIERNLWKSFSTTKAVLVLIMALAVAVAAINVGSSLIMLALERKKDIAILKSCGCGPSQIASIFINAGAIIGISGTASGLAIGSAIAISINQIISGIETLAGVVSRMVAWLSNSPLPPPFRLLNPSYYLEKIPVHISMTDLALVAVSAVLLCVLSSLFPALKASRLPPMEIFRKS